MSMWLVSNGTIDHASITLAGNRSYGILGQSPLDLELIPHGLHYYLKAAGMDKLVHLKGGAHDGSDMELWGSEHADEDDGFDFDLEEDLVNGGYLLKNPNRDLYVEATNDTDGVGGIQLHGDKTYAETHPNSHFDVIRLDPEDNTTVTCEGPLKPLESTPTTAPTPAPTPTPEPTSAPTLPLCGPLSQTVGRCGEGYGRCNLDIGTKVKHCNEDNNWCGNSNWHINAQPSDAFDWEPSKSCQVTSPTPAPTPEPQDTTTTFIYPPQIHPL